MGSALMGFRDRGGPTDHCSSRFTSLAMAALRVDGGCEAARKTGAKMATHAPMLVVP